MSENKYNVVARDEMTDEEFNARMSAAYNQAMSGEYYTLGEAFSIIFNSLNNQE